MSYVPKFLLRWRFEWPDKPVKYGMWSHSGTQEDLATKAWCNNGPGLAFAVVEAKNYLTREIKPVVVCPGQDFRNFQWIALANVPGFVKGKMIPVTRVGGIILQTRDEEITVHDCGKVLRAPFTAHNINFATYGK